MSSSLGDSPGSEGNVWPPPPTQSMPPQVGERHCFFDELNNKPLRSQLVAFVISFLTSLVLLFVLLIAAAEVQQHFYRNYEVVERYEINYQTLRSVAFCIWGSVLILNLTLAYLWRRFTSYTQAFLVWATIFSFASLYYIWSMPTQIQ